MKYLVTFYATIFGLFLFMMAGWVVNIVWLLKYTGEVTAAFYVSLVGVVFVPLGSISGWLSAF